ncbi:MAG TPA: RluA family pseudouridine synthase [Thermoleophilaceae bacterium]|nr:RluA family pseudouridine synthase [Thermoleophilaceae bacterium]
MSQKRFVATEDDAGLRLDAALVSRGVIPSRAKAQRAIVDRLVRVDGRVRRASHRMAAGEEVVMAEADPSAQGGEQPEVAVSVVHEDSHLMVVDKPTGVVVHPGAGHSHGTLSQALAGRAAGGPDPGRAGIVHRLDRDTSGLLIVAKSEEAHAALSRMLRERRVQREYLALVEGCPDARTGTIDAPIGRDRDHRTRMSTRTDRARSAVTHFEVIEALPRTTLLSVRLETGRTHQIRAHLSAIGHPVCGDSRYGGGESGRRLELTRQFLHSTRLMFEHPVTREFLACESRLPADLHRAVDAARRERVPGGPDGD